MWGALLCLPTADGPVSTKHESHSSSGGEKTWGLCFLQNHEGVYECSAQGVHQMGVSTKEMATATKGAK